MFDNENSLSPSQNDDQQNPSYDYLTQADCACDSGDLVLGMHLYLAAFENLSTRSSDPAAADAAFASLKQAWDLAVQLRERTIAEYAFERLSQLVSPEEADELALQLQDLAFDRLQDFGLTRDDLRDVTNFIAQEVQTSMGSEMQTAFASAVDAVRDAVAQEAANADDGLAAAGSVLAAAPAEPQAQAAKAPAASGAGGASRPVIKSITPIALNVPLGGKAASAPSNAQPSGAATKRVKTLNYSDLVGYDSVIASMRQQGIGMQQDEDFKRLVEFLNLRHGVDSMPSSDALVFSSPAREDALHFMEATYGEIGLPAIRMRMEEGPQGFPMLCVMMQQDNQPKLNAAKNAFEGDGVLILEDIDLWSSPYETPQPSDEVSGLLMASMSRGAREAMNLIRSAVEQPNVRVLASMSSLTELDPFIASMLEPLTLVHIEMPNQQEREAIWHDIFTAHPSMRGLDQDELVRYSAGMPRYDIYMAAQEAVDQAYRDSLAVRGYVPVTSANMYEKLALYHPLESNEYKQLEDQAVHAMSMDFDQLEKFMNGEMGE